jgi:lysophospholipase L1-like esterase
MEDSSPPDLRRSRVRRLLPRCALSATSFVLALCAAELAVRALFPAVPARGGGGNLGLIEEGVASQPPGLTRTLRANAQASAVYPGAPGHADRTVLYRTNEHGFRGASVARERQAGVQRWAVLGDSFTFGTGVGEEETLPVQLAERVHALAPHTPTEVLNWGVPAYNAREATALLAALQPRFTPDRVLYVLYINDASGIGISSKEPAPDDWRLRWIQRLGLTSGVWAPEDPKTPAQRRMMLARVHSRFVDLLAHKVYRRWTAQLTIANYQRDWQPGSPSLLWVRRSLDYAAELARTRGFQLELTMYPDLATLGPDYPYAEQHAWVAAWCAAQHVPYHDLMPAFAGRMPHELVAHAHDSHPNGFANGLAAQSLAASLLSTADPAAQTEMASYR